MSWYFQAPEPMDRGKTELSVIGIPPGRQIWPPWVWPLSRRLKPEYAACRYTSGVCEIRIENLSRGIAEAAEIKALATSLNSVTLVEQHPYSHRLQARHHANCVVIAKHGVDWALEAGT